MLGRVAPIYFSINNQELSYIIQINHITQAIMAYDLLAIFFVKEEAK